jgi:hypothetical protein
MLVPFQLWETSETLVSANSLKTICAEFRHKKVGTALAGKTNPSKYPNELPSLPFRTYPPISAPIGARLSV